MKPWSRTRCRLSLKNTMTLVGGAATSIRDSITTQQAEYPLEDQVADYGLIDREQPYSWLLGKDGLIPVPQCPRRRDEYRFGRRQSARKPPEGGLQGVGSLPRHW